MYKKSIVSFALVPALLCACAFAGYPGQLGVNIGSSERCGTYTNQVNDNYRFTDTAGADLIAGQTDSQGWPSIDFWYIVDWRPCAEWEGAIYIGSYDGHLYALSGETGKEIWRFKTGGKVYASCLVRERYRYSMAFPSGSNCNRLRGRERQYHPNITIC